MRLTSIVILLLLATAICAAKNGKKKKNRKSNKKPPQWKPSSMPSKDKKFFYVDEGDTQTLDCRAKGKPRPKVTWYHNGRPLQSDVDSVTIKRSGDLILEGVTPDRSGNYTCFVKNSVGDLEWNFNLQIQKTTMEMKLTGPRNITAQAGSTVQFNCQVLNDPDAMIRWYRGKVENRDFLPDDPNNPNKGMLTLETITKANEGIYGCQASNLWTTKSKDAYLTVFEPRSPVRTTTDSSVTIVPWFYGPDRYPTTRRPRTDQGLFFTTRRNRHGSRVDGYLTTKKPRHRNGQRKNKDKKNRKKDKDKNNKKNKGQPKNDFDNFGDNEEEEDYFMITTMKPKPMKTAPTTVLTFPEVKPTGTVIWKYDKDKVKPNGHDDDDTKTDDRLKTHGEKEKKNSDQEEDVPGSISSWTIYTIVGAVGGVVLLIGLVAITLTLCCRREDEGVYKSTSV